MFARCSAKRVVGVLLTTSLLGFVAGGLALSPAAGNEPADRAVIGKAKGLSYVVELLTITDLNPFDVVNCPAQTAVTGGGTFNDTEETASTQITNSTPQPAGDPGQKPDEGWLSETRSTVPGGSAMYTYAICSDRPGKLRYVSKAVIVTGNESESVKAKCPRDTAVTGGGAFTDGDLDDMAIVGSRPDPSGERAKPRRWHARARNYEGDPHSLTSYAICSKQESKYSYRRKTVEIPQVVDGASADKVVSCPKRRAVSGGGADIVGGNTAGARYLTSSSPRPAGTFDQTPKKGWIAEGVSNQGETLRVWAICKKK